MEDGKLVQTIDSRFPTCTDGEKLAAQITAALGEGAKPVSYTHLDVYKRQCHGRADRSVPPCIMGASSRAFPMRERPVLR